MTTEEALEILVKNTMELIDNTSQNTFVQDVIQNGSIEIIKAAITLGFGLYSFKMYQRYKNKKENTQTYIEVIKLKKELEKNHKVLVEVLELYNEKEGLNRFFKFQEPNGDGLLDIFSRIKGLDVYYGYTPIMGEYGEQVGVDGGYDEKPYDEMQNIEHEIWGIENYEHWDEHDKYIRISELNTIKEKYGKMNIFVDLISLQEKVKNLLQEECNLQEELQFLNEKLEKYNSFEECKKKKYIDKFMELLNERENIFSTAFKKYKRLKQLERELRYDINKSKIELILEQWKDRNIDLLVVQDVNKYLEIEELYRQLSLCKIDKSNRDSIEHAKYLIEDELLKILEEQENKIFKILKKTTKLFKDI